MTSDRRGDSACSAIRELQDCLLGPRAKEHHAMAPLKFVAIALAVSVFGVATVTSTAIADKAAADKDKAAQRNAYLTRVMKNNGFSDAKAKGVVGSITRYQK